jgi:lipoprotein-anchoring transpeptidase ErfK/SrfK
MMSSTKRFAATALAAVLWMGGAAPGQAQSAPLAMFTSGGSAGARGESEITSPALARGRYAVVIDLNVNRLFFKQGEVTLWSAPIGTGTGLRLKAEDQEWDFSTPSGIFHVKYKEENPVWIAPDWYFIENDLPIPPANDKRRLFPGGLGAAAVYIDHDLAIHGTDKPELLGQRVSHGCIRMANKDAIRLFHNVQVGTEVVIVGGERAPKEAEAPKAVKGNDPSTFNPAAPKPQPKDPLLEDWKRMSTRDLLVVLGDELWMNPKTSRWPEVARLLLNRGLEDDDLALRGLLLGVNDLPTTAVEREYRTFLVDAFARRPVRTMEALSQLDPRYRERAAEAIVTASIGLFPGELDAHGVPWPTTRMPKSLIGPEARRGWLALSRVEQRLREEGQHQSL